MDIFKNNKNVTLIQAQKQDVNTEHKYLYRPTKCLESQQSAL